MKKQLFYLLLIALGTFFFVSCNKKKLTLTTADKIIGTWQVQSDIYHQKVGSYDYTDTVSTSGTIEFRNDNRVYSDIQGQKDTAVYTIDSDTQLTIVGVDTYQIKTLTDHQLVLYVVVTNSTGLYEETISLLK
jgi:hypothetical protein